MEKLQTAQNYIDETPIWSDGTIAPKVPMTKMQWKIWFLATAGKFFEGMVVFMTGIAMPLISLQYSTTSFENGILGASSLAGILVGATALGGLADRYGRKKMFIAEMVIFVICIIALTFSFNFWLVVIALFGAGIALGCDYPTAHLMISESIPSRNRGKLVLGAFAFQAVGAIFGTGIGYLVLYYEPNIDAWRDMYAVIIIPAILVIIARLSVTESPHWLVASQRYIEAEKELSVLLKRVPMYPKVINLRKKDKSHTQKEVKGTYKDLFTKHRKATIFASVPWFIQDLATYGIGIFTPLILTATIGAKISVQTATDVIHNDLLAAKSTAFIEIFFLVGIIFAIFLSDKLGRVKLQILGFIGCAIGLVIATIGNMLDQNITLIFIGFILFQFMTNLGPNSQTYLIAGEVFPTKVRGIGAGTAASIAKIGAVIAVVLFPVLMNTIGTNALLFILAGTSILGAWITHKYKIETAGKNLENIGLD